MATADELLAAAVAAEADKTLVIDNDLRTITIPPSVKNLGVASDDDVTRLHFRMPSMYGDIDLSKFDIRINYLNANGGGDVYVVTDKKTDGDTITFSWLVGRFATAYKGAVSFIACLKLLDDTGEVTKEFNTTVAKLPVLEGLETTEQIVQQHPDVLEAILRRLDKLEKNSITGNVSEEQIAAAVAEYLANNPVNIEHPVERVESLDEENMRTLRNLDSGIYILYGYFKPFPDSDSTIILDNLLVHVYWHRDGSYVSYMSADDDVDVYEILVDESTAAGYTFDRTKVPLLEVYKLLQNGVSASRIADVELPAANWLGDTSPYSQVVVIDGITEKSQVDLTPSVEQLAIFYDKSLAFVAENEDGVVTVYAIGQKPTNDYTIQATITEVNV